MDLFRMHGVQFFGYVQRVSRMRGQGVFHKVSCRSGLHLFMIFNIPLAVFHALGESLKRMIHTSGNRGDTFDLGMEPSAEHREFADGNLPFVGVDGNPVCRNIYGRIARKRQ